MGFAVCSGRSVRLQTFAYSDRFPVPPFRLAPLTALRDYVKPKPTRIPMPHRLQLTPGTSLDAIPPCKRGVKLAPFTEETGYRWLWSVNSKGVRIGLRCVPPGADFNPYVDDLWDELDRVDPTPGAVSSRTLQLIA